MRKNAEIGIRPAAASQDPDGTPGIYQVLRLKKDIAPTSWIGGMLTGVGAGEYAAGVFRRHGLEPPARRRTLCRGRLSRGSGVLGRRREPRRRGRAAPLLHGSPANTGSPPSPMKRSAGFNSNDLGFFAQPHEHGGYAQLIYRENFAALPAPLATSWQSIRNSGGTGTAYGQRRLFSAAFRRSSGISGF